MMNPHTLKRMKTEALLTTLSDREARESWEKKGSLDTHRRAMIRVQEILSRPSSALFPSDIESNIHMQFKDLVPGNLDTIQTL
jgi:trimethylamine:corrinoid methyltransferase-like protein